jgi:hypothetical protein
MNKEFLVSVADVYGYDSNDNLLFVGKTSLDSSIETTLANTDVRAGKGNQLQFIYYHTAEMNITINESQFSLPYLALNVGSSITVGKNMFKEETVTVTDGAGTILGTPLAVSTSTIYGWVDVNGTTERVAFNSKSFQLSDPTFDGDVCVRYYTYDSAAESITINADMMPSTIRLVMEATLASDKVGTTSKIGTVQIEVPKASMTGQFTISMTPDGVASTPLSVRALASKTVSGGCATNRPIYATITKKVDSANWYDNVVALAIEGGDFSLAVDATKTLQVFAITSTGSTFLAPIADLTFATGTPATATVSSVGLVTGKAAGTSTLKATITAKTSVDASAVVTVA